jgi:vancomycin resistance protein VanJ
MMTKRIVVLLTAAYALALIVYLVLRFALRDTLWWLAFLHNFAPYYFAPLLALIPLLFIVKARGTAVRLLPLLLIGLLLFGPRWLPKPVVNAAGDTPSIKLVTFNVLVLTEDYERIIAWLRATDADVILLQEVDDAETPVIIESLVDAYPYQVDLIGTTLLALSRYPIREQSLVDLGAWFIDRFVLEVEGQALAIYNMHMHLPIRDEPHIWFDTHKGMVNLFLKYDEFHRNRLIHRLLELLAQEDLPYIVAGDFNTSDNALIYDDMMAVMRDSFRETNTGLGTTWPAAAGDDPLPGIIPPLLRIDYVWHSTNLRALATEIGPDLGSDHLPVVATLGLG